MMAAVCGSTRHVAVADRESPRRLTESDAAGTARELHSRAPLFYPVRAYAARAKVRGERLTVTADP